MRHIRLHHDRCMGDGICGSIGELDDDGSRTHTRWLRRDLFLYGDSRVPDRRYDDSAAIAKVPMQERASRARQN